MAIHSIFIFSWINSCLNQCFMKIRSFVFHICKCTNVRLRAHPQTISICRLICSHPLLTTKAGVFQIAFLSEFPFDDPKAYQNAEHASAWLKQNRSSGLLPSPCGALLAATLSWTVFPRVSGELEIPTVRFLTRTPPSSGTAIPGERPRTTSIE